jgi:nucleoside-diphosphate-sugar epimerase
MHVFLAGASGYAGHAVAIALRQAGHHVPALLRYPDSGRARALRVQEVRVVAGNLNRPATYRAELAACDVCITTALDFADPAGTDRLLFEVLRNLPAKADGKRLFIYTTGALVYGKVPAGVLDEATPGNPAHPLHFRLELEQEVFELDNLRTVVVRPGFLYGLDGRSCFAQTWFEQGEAGRVVYGGDPARRW